MLFQITEEQKTYRYIQKILNNRNGFPSQIFPLNEQYNIVLGTYTKYRTKISAEYGVWLISKDMRHISDGIAGFGVTTPTTLNADWERLTNEINAAIYALNLNNKELIENNYIAYALYRELRKKKFNKML